MNRRHFLAGTAAGALAALPGCGGASYDFELLNVSYDPTRELYRLLNRQFAEAYLARTGLRGRVRQSHGGSGSQARAVVDGIPADVVTLAMWTDIDTVRAKKLIAEGWEKRLPDESLPYHSTIVFCVRKGNPYGISDWPDLLKPGVQVITANPKTGGGAKLALLAAWGAALRTGRDPRAFVAELFRRVPVLDTGARGATVTFARKNIGDVHLTWENEAWLEKRELKGEVEIVYPKMSVRAEPHVALVDATVDARGTRAHATAYLEHLYTDAAQEVIAETFFRPQNAAVAARHAARFPKIDLFRATELGLGNWNKIQTDFFAEGGVFDQLYQPAK
jgi:sulfate/thiosulfate-binding protein